MRLYGDFDARGEVTNIKMTLTGSGIPVEELQAFLPPLGITLPKGAAFAGGTLDAEIVSEGFLNDLTIDCSMEIAGTSLTGFNLGDKIAPIASIAGLKSSMDTQIEKLRVSMRRTANGITVNNIHLVIPALGEISGAGTISPRHELDLTMRVAVSHNALTAFTKEKAIGIGFFIRGDAANPEFIPDYNDAARVIIDAVLTGKGSGTGSTNKLIDSLKGLLGNK
jgi:AsmA protein